MTVCNAALALSTYVQPDVWEIVEQGTKKHLSTLSPAADHSPYGILEKIATSDEQIKKPRKITVISIGTGSPRNPDKTSASLSWGPIQMLKENLDNALTNLHNLPVGPTTRM